MSAEGDKQHLQARLPEQLDALWEQEQCPDVRAFLHQAGERSLAEIIDVLQVDQRRRWQRGERVFVEQYLEAFPQISASAKAISFIYGEYCLRAEQGEAPQTAEYTRRFPAHAEALQRQFEVHQAITVASSTDPSSLGSKLTPVNSTAAVPQPSPKPAAPPQIDGYEILDKIGKGGMGIVYRARQLKLGRAVAVKIISLERLTRPSAVSRFQREAIVAARLEHENIVRLYDAGECQGVQFLVMEHVDGIDLEKLLEQRGARPVARACDYIRQAALGLEYAHEHELGLVHRDIKPANLMVSPVPAEDGQSGLPPTKSGIRRRTTVKILDFGLARLRRRGGPVGSQTSEGAMMGTPDYMAPEQAEDPRQVDARADLYSLGCTYYHLLTGQKPFPGDNVLQKFDGHRHKTATPIPQLAPHVPAEIVAIVEKLMRKRPNERFQTAGELVDVLEPWATTSYYASK